ncbi:acyltransferase family protein [Pontibacter roseus]|uniref:acyltransferase family protein n=1 Tax=Pontibacter roseus TaxID=336989 RepID=UPI00036B8159|nr:acyltransferase [Pontibacter roseus]
MENQLKTRRYELDWLRVLAFSLLIFYHTGMFFVSWEWHVKNNVLSETLELPMLFLSQWRMSLIFLISGAGVYLAMGYRGAGAFAMDRVKRILVPLLVGILVVVPPQVYFERLTQGHTYSYASFWPTIFEFIPYPEGNFSWHHLWYLAYIFTYSLLLLPLLRFLRSKRTDFTHGKGWFLLLVPLLLSVGEMLLREKFDATNALVDDWANHFLYGSLFLLGFGIISSPTLQDKIRQARWYSLGGSLLLVTVLYTRYWLPDPDLEGMELNLYWVLKSFNRWGWIMTILGFAMQHLNVRHRYLPLANQMVYPFYILHQTVIVVLGYYMREWPWPVAAKFALLVTATFLICFVLTRFVIMKVIWLRVPFGLKPEKKKPAAIEPAPVQAV